MRFLIAPDSFKESLSAEEACAAVQRGIASVMPDAEFDLAPLADGGEGTGECLRKAWGAERRSCTVCGPMGLPIHSTFVMDAAQRCAVIETAMCCGIMLVEPSRRDPMRATSRGVGEMMLAAYKAGCRTLVVTLGGSVVNDGGIGMLQALGASITDENGEPVPLGGRALSGVSRVDISSCGETLRDAELVVLCDVDCKLLGPNGATRFFGPQKGASPEQIESLETGMSRYAQALQKACGMDVAALEGAGAAGGIGAALLALQSVVPVRVCSGADYLMNQLDIPNRIRQSDVVIVGEGSMDAQSLEGKLPIRIAEMAREYQRPVIAMVGSVWGEPEIFRRHGIDAVFSILRKVAPLDTVLQDAEENLQYTAETFASVLALSRRCNHEKRYVLSKHGAPGRVVFQEAVRRESTHGVRRSAAPSAGADSDGKTAVGVLLPLRGQNSVS